jgi:hypothetical protein
MLRAFFAEEKRRELIAATSQQPKRDTYTQLYLAGSGKLSFLWSIATRCHGDSLSLGKFTAFCGFWRFASQSPPWAVGRERTLARLVLRRFSLIGLRSNHHWLRVLDPSCVPLARGRRAVRGMMLASFTATPIEYRSQRTLESWSNLNAWREKAGVACRIEFPVFIGPKH